MTNPGRTNLARASRQAASAERAVRAIRQRVEMLGLTGRSLPFSCVDRTCYSSCSTPEGTPKQWPPPPSFCAARQKKQCAKETITMVLNDGLIHLLANLFAATLCIKL